MATIGPRYLAVPSVLDPARSSASECVGQLRRTIRNPTVTTTPRQATNEPLSDSIQAANASSANRKVHNRTEHRQPTSRIRTGCS
ncbi:hypothetical protein DIPPA_24082 [Diplonema papillatum]|nr:hypothetical protein DIPPA_24082 [Diplonema papillatum]